MQSFSERRDCYLNMTAIEMREPQYQDTHCIKGDVPKEKREAMSEDEQRAIPILGGLRPIERKDPPQMQVNGTLGEDAFAPSDDDLPF